MKNIMKTIVTIMVMAMVITGFTPTVAEAKGKTSITVVNKATGTKMSKKNTLKVGQKLQLRVKSGKKDVTKKAKYKASNKNVKVSKSGKITAKKAGSCKITIKYGKKSKNVTFAIKANTSTVNDTTTNYSLDDVWRVQFIEKNGTYVAKYACDSSSTPIYEVEEIPWSDLYGEDGDGFLGLRTDVLAQHIVRSIPNGSEGSSKCNHNYVWDCGIAYMSGHYCFSHGVVKVCPKCFKICAKENWK
ncbi:MAG: hypothetical protein IJ733_03330 [Lachnospiraceae bacterium]|nr:hypothetical protein [Lachnospiraceae bacterium]